MGPVLKLPADPMELGSRDSVPTRVHRLRRILPTEAGKDRVVGGEVVISPDGVLVDPAVASVGVAVVLVGGSGHVGRRRWNQLHRLQVDRAHHALGNPVVGEGLPLSTRHIKGVVELRNRSAGSGAREVSPGHGRRRDRQETDGLEVVDEALVVSVEEGPVLDDGATHGSAEDLIVHRQLAGPGPVGEEIGRIQALIPEVVPSVTVELVGPALGEHADHGPTYATVLGRVVVGDDLELLHRLRCGLDHGPLGDIALVIGPVQCDLVGVGVEPVEGGIAAAVGVHLLSVPDLGPLLDATRGQIGQLHKIPSSNGQVQDFPLLDHRPDLGRGRIYDCRLTRDRHLLGNLTRRQSEVDPGHLGHLQTHTQGDLGLEARELHLQVVPARNELVDEVVSPVVGNRQTRHIRGRGRGLDFYSGHHGAGLVRDRPQQPCIGGGLSVYRCGRQRGGQRQECHRRTPLPLRYLSHHFPLLLPDANYFGLVRGIEAVLQWVGADSLPRICC